MPIAAAGSVPTRFTGEALTYETCEPSRTPLRFHVKLAVPIQALLLVLTSNASRSADMWRGIGNSLLTFLLLSLLSESTLHKILSLPSVQLGKEDKQMLQVDGGVAPFRWKAVIGQFATWSACPHQWTNSWNIGSEKELRRNAPQHGVL